MAESRAGAPIVLAVGSPMPRAGATYIIVFIQGERVLRQIRWDFGLESAKRYARDYMAIRKADRVEVRDEKDRIVFRP